MNIKDLGTFDRIVAILGILLAIPTFLEFLQARVVNGLLLIILMMVVAGFLAYRHFQRRLPPFTYLKVEKTLTFVDELPHKASQVSVVTVKANHSGLTQLWFRSISADGPVENFIIDGDAVPEHLIQKKAGSYEVCKQFDHALISGDTREVTLSYDMIDAYPKRREGTTHAVVTITKKLKIVIRFHPAKIGREVQCFVGGGAGLERRLPPPQTLDNGSVLELELQDLQLGAYYTIDWRW
ncbi:MAG: hypothetical protein ACLPHP_16245 [Candidatus Sulfotelmatobacter sp.]